MGRWQPNAQQRLEEAAMELFGERGYDHTTVEEIAAQAGLTERTFFRYFKDKREVLFSRSKDLEKLMVDAVVGAPATAPPLHAVASALEATSALFEKRRAHARKRQALIVAHAELQERELIKLAGLASAVAESLCQRGVERAASSLIAEAGIAIFKSAFERWVRGGKHDLAHHIRAVLGELRLATAEIGARSMAPHPARRRPPKL
jgi:AcrR family transcriptional regulator